MKTLQEIDTARPDATTDGVEYTVEQRIRYDYSEPVRDLRQRLMVVPSSRHGRQCRLDWSIDADGAEPDSMCTRRDSFGNVCIEIVVPTVASWIEFDVRSSVAFRDDGLPFVIRRDGRFTRPTRLTAPDDAIALLLPDRDRLDPELICDRVYRALTYEFGATDVQTTAAEALAQGRGVCQDYAHLMVAVCRLSGMAARYVSGHLLGEGGSHAWVEVLRDDETTPGRWRVEAWDPTHCRRTDDRYITTATGRDYSDVAPMSGTFFGAAIGTLTVQKRAQTRHG